MLTQKEVVFMNWINEENRVVIQQIDGGNDEEFYDCKHE